MQRYNPKDIEPKWQKSWQDSQLYKAVDFDSRPKYVMLTEFPYPSGDGLHLGHMREYTLGDIVARHKRMNGFNVMYPMGYDEFGLPTENYAIKNKVTPQAATAQNVGNFQKQFENLGFSFDWDRVVHTSDPNYYKWTQWLFLQFYKAGLAYQDEIAINWCPHCKTGLANEEVVNGRHERCDTLVEKKLLKQWLLKITQYADRLIDGLKSVDYPSRIADQQINWIGRSQGAEINFQVEGSEDKIKVFTTRPDTIFGATFLVLAPEHPLVEKLVTADHKSHVNSYIKMAQAKTEVERQDVERDKTGVPLGAHVINPANGEKIPVWIADYVLMGYGTGAIMAVPAHDDRDYAFAKNFNLPIQQVIAERFIHAGNEPNKDGPMVPRQVVCAIVKHPTEDKILMSKPNGSDYWSSVMGGIDEGETAEDAAKRELAEESGYTDIKSVKVYDNILASEFYAQHKKENRIAYIKTVVIELNSLDKQAISDEEKDKQTLEWVTPDEAYKRWVGAAGKEILQISQGIVRPMVFEGRLVNSGEFDGMPTSEAREKIVDALQQKGVAEAKVNYRLRDWIFSRQHYWGEPIPIIHCPDHGAVPVPDDQLPVELPKIEHYEPTDTGESPLAAIDDWVNTECPVCGKPARRETDTMPNWAGSSWYYLRYDDPHNERAFADRKKLDYWGAVDFYLGGMEHTTLHLLYSRFWHQFFYDQGLVPTPEPYASRRGQGIILAADGSKMSKSKGNVINPNQILDDGYGADALRLAIAFLAPYDQTTPWNPEGVAGTYRFLQRIWTMVQEFKEVQPGQADSTELLRIVHKAIKKVSQDLEGLNFNTAIAALMETVNSLYHFKAQDKFQAAEWGWALRTLLQLLSPYAPHLSEELWQQLGYEGSIHVSEWPKFDDKYLQQAEMVIVVQVNGKLRAEIQIASGAQETEVIEAAKSNERIAELLKGAEIKKSIYVPGRLVNFVI